MAKDLLNLTEEELEEQDKKEAQKINLPLRAAGLIASAIVYPFQVIGAKISQTYEKFREYSGWS